MSNPAFPSVSQLCGAQYLGESSSSGIYNKVSSAGMAMTTGDVPPVLHQLWSVGSFVDKLDDNDSAMSVYSVVQLHVTGVECN